MFYTALFLAFVKTGMPNDLSMDLASAYLEHWDKVHVASLRLHVKCHGAGSLRYENGRMHGI